MDNALNELRQEEIRTQTRNIERKIARVTIDKEQQQQEPQQQQQEPAEASLNTVGPTTN